VDRVEATSQVAINRAEPFQQVRISEYREVMKE